MGVALEQYRIYKQSVDFFAISTKTMLTLSTRAQINSDSTNFYYLATSARREIRSQGRCV